MAENSYRFFCNKDCKFFPCHETDDEDNFNCMFCHCPLYVLGDECGGDFKYIGGVCKDCSDCLLPHQPEQYDYIMSRYVELMDLAHERHRKPDPKP